MPVFNPAQDNKAKWATREHSHMAPFRSLIERYYPVASARIAVVADSRTALTRWVDNLDAWFADRHNIARAPELSSGTNLLASEGWTGTGTFSEGTHGAAGSYWTLTAGQSRTITFREPTTALSVFYGTNTGNGTIRVKAATTGVLDIDTNAALSWSNLQTTPAQTLAARSWTIEAVTADVRVEYIIPHAETTPTTGVKAAMFAKSGYDLNEWLTLTDCRTALRAWLPDAIVIMSSVNEATAEDIISQTTEFVRVLREDFGMEIPILFCAPESLSNSSRLDMTQAALDLSDELGITFANVHAVLGSNATDGDKQRNSDDSVHWNNTCADAIVNLIAGALSGDYLSVMIGHSSRFSESVRAATVQIRPILPINGVIDLGSKNFFGYSAIGQYSGEDHPDADDITGESKQAQILQVASDLATFLTGLGVTMPGQGWLFGPGGSTTPTDYLAYVSGVLRTNMELQINSTGSMGTIEKLRVGTPGTVDNTTNVLFAASASTSNVLALQAANSHSANILTIESYFGANLFSIDASGAINYMNGNAAPTGWGTPTNTLTRTTFDTTTVTLGQLAERVGALISDMKTVMGLIRA